MIGAVIGLGPPRPDDEAAVRAAVRTLYAVYSEGRDPAKYRSLLTEDYLLLENGRISDVAGDVASLTAPAAGYRRTDAFDFRSVKVLADTGYAVYFLTSEIADQKAGPRTKEWLESAILRRAGVGWRVALLHSTVVKSGA